MAVTKLCLAAEAFSRRFSCDPVHIPNLHAAMEQILARAENDRVVFRTNLTNEIFLRQAQPQSPVLADGVADDAAVPP